MGPQEHVTVGTCDVVLVGTIAGFVPDGDRVRAALEAVNPTLVALGIPPEDVATLKSLADAAEPVEMPEPDDVSTRLLAHLKRFGETRVPSPDLEAAFVWARVHDATVAALDLDDAAHAEAYTKRVKLRHVVRSNSRRRKLLAEEFKDASDPYVLAVEWEAYMGRIRPLAELETLRETHMARRLHEAARVNARVVAVVPVARLAGIAASLRAPEAGTARGEVNVR